MQNLGLVEEPAPTKLKVLAQVPDGENRLALVARCCGIRRRYSVHCRRRILTHLSYIAHWFTSPLTRLPEPSWRWHATKWPGATSRTSGTSHLQISVIYGQRL